MVDSPLVDSVAHFWSSAFAALLAYFSTSITCSRWYARISRSRSTISLAAQADRSIFLFSLSVGLIASIAAHIYIDYYAGGREGVLRFLGIH